MAGSLSCSVIRPPVVQQDLPGVISDVSRLNPVTVHHVLVPTTTEEIRDAVARHAGPISIGGSRHSMGGQIAAPGGLHIDMRRFDRILEFDPIGKTITVQAGTRWRQIQSHIDSVNLSVKVMQSYANFTVGGSLSVNAHGRYVGYGPLVNSVRAIKIVIANGEIVEASPIVRSEVFYGAIGGYGGIGVITEVTLELAENIPVRRYHLAMPVEQYKQFFIDRIQNSRAVVFHNADLYPDDYETVRAISYVDTGDRPTESRRLIEEDRSYVLERLAAWVVSELPFGKKIRRDVIDPLRLRHRRVVWRNYEASRDVDELEPTSRSASTYVLQEYFIPVERFDEFVPAMREVLRRNGINVLNVSIRHASADTSTLLNWAAREVFAFVIYYKQKTDTASQRAVGEWSRELIDAALRSGGSYYLPYQLHATREQFLAAYPRAQRYFALKARLDPANKFRNLLIDKYYRP
jgi:FAD/FMN-containing dehydrogenase